MTLNTVGSPTKAGWAGHQGAAHQLQRGTEGVTGTGLLTRVLRIGTVPVHFALALMQQRHVQLIIPAENTSMLNTASYAGAVFCGGKAITSFLASHSQWLGTLWQTGYGRFSAA